MHLCHGREAHHQDIVYEGRQTDCPLCAANQSLADARAEVSRLEGRVERVEEEITDMEVAITLLEQDLEEAKGDPA